MINNILAKALGLIRGSFVEARHYTTGTTNEFGISIKGYGEWAQYDGIVEPGIVSAFGGKNISEKDYEFMGLDWSRYYVTAWIKGANLENIHSDTGTDQIRYNGKVFNVIQIANWSEYDGWQRCYCVEDTNV